MQTVPVLVREDTVYRESRPDPNGARLLLLNRQPASAPPAAPFLAYQSRRAPPQLFEDRFVSVYAVIEAYQQAAMQVVPSMSLLLWPVAKPPPEPEFETRRADHSLLFRFRGVYVAQLVGDVVYQPDFCDDPWLEQVHRPANPEVALFPFRQIPQFIRGQQFNLFFNQPKPWYVDSEADPVTSRAYRFTLLDYYRPQVYTPPPAGFRVIAVSRGYYNGSWRDPGDVFDLLSAADYSSSAVSQVPVGNALYPLYGWMQQVPETTPLYSYALSNYGLSSVVVATYSGASIPPPGIWGISNNDRTVL